MKKYYRIVEITKKNEVKTLFHGIRGSRVLPFNEWLVAEKKMVNDNGPEYLSGFHILPTRETCEKYLEAFDLNKRKLIILEVFAKGLRRKKHSRQPVYLADKIFIPKFDLQAV